MILYDGSWLLSMMQFDNYFNHAEMNNQLSAYLHKRA